MKPLRSLQRGADSRLGREVAALTALEAAAREHRRAPGVARNASVGHAMQHAIRMCGGVWDGRWWKAPAL